MAADGRDGQIGISWSGPPALLNHWARSGRHGRDARRPGTHGESTPRALVKIRGFIANNRRPRQLAENLSFFPLRFLWRACRDDRKRLPLQIGYKGIARNTIFVRRQMDDVLIDGAGSERHQIGIRYLGNWWNEIPGLHDHNPKARGIEAQRGEVLNLMERTTPSREHQRDPLDVHH